MPGKDGTGPLGMGPCGKGGHVCRKRRDDTAGRKNEKKRPDAGDRQPDQGTG